MFFKYIIISLSLIPCAFSSFSDPTNPTINKSFKSYNSTSNFSTTTINNNHYSSVSNHYHKNNRTKYIVQGIAISGILFLLYKIWKAHRD